MASRAFERGDTCLGVSGLAGGGFRTSLSASGGTTTNGPPSGAAGLASTSVGASVEDSSSCPATSDADLEASKGHSGAPAPASTVPSSQEPERPGWNRNWAGLSFPTLLAGDLDGVRRMFHRMPGVAGCDEHFSLTSREPSAGQHRAHAVLTKTTPQRDEHRNHVTSITRRPRPGPRRHQPNHIRRSFLRDGIHLVGCGGHGGPQDITKWRNRQPARLWSPGRGTNLPLNSGATPAVSARRMDCTGVSAPASVARRLSLPDLPAMDHPATNPRANCLVT